jgi:hypothetical protein
LGEYINDYYNVARPHQGIEQQTPIPYGQPKNTGTIQSRKVLGGILNDYYGDIICDNYVEIKGDISFALSFLYDVSVIAKDNTTGEPNTIYLTIMPKYFIPETESVMQPVTPMHLESVEQDDGEQVVRFRDK